MELATNVAEGDAEPAAPTAPEPDGPGREAEEPSDESVAEGDAEPAAPTAPEPDGPGREAEEPSEV